MNFRKMKELGEDGQTIKIIEHIILKNMWEIYVIQSDKEEEEESLADGELFTLTMGHFTEMGSQWESELKGNIVSRTKELHGILPAEGWKWVGED